MKITIDIRKLAYAKVAEDCRNETDCNVSPSDIIVEKLEQIFGEGNVSLVNLKPSVSI